MLSTNTLSFSFCDLCTILAITGIITPVNIPITTITTIISSSVKPLLVFITSILSIYNLFKHRLKIYNTPIYSILSYKNNYVKRNSRK